MFSTETDAEMHPESPSTTCGLRRGKAGPSGTVSDPRARCPGSPHSVAHHGRTEKAGPHPGLGHHKNQVPKVRSLTQARWVCYAKALVGKKGSWHPEQGLPG